MYKFALLFKNKTPLEDGNTDHYGCIFCDPVLRPLVEMKHVTQRRTRTGAPRGRPGRGRGRGGRPRGKGRGKPKDKMAQLAAYFV